MNLSCAYIDVSVVDELRRNVCAAFPSGRRWHVSVTVPLPAGTVGVGSGRGGMLHTGGGHNPNRLALKSNNIDTFIYLFAAYTSP